MDEQENYIYAIKTTAKHERTVADNIVEVLKDHGEITVTAIISPDELRGYVLVESPDEIARMEQLRELVPHARAVVKGSSSIEEVQHFLEPKPVVAGIDEGAFVELVAGPFKGEKAVVKRVDISKEEITVELYECMVPIPITVRGDNVRLIDNRSDD